MNKAIQKTLDVYKVITITHKTTSIQRLKDYLVDADGSEFPKKRLQEMKESFGMDELLYLNTCNRVTFLFTGDVNIHNGFLANFFHFINPSLKKDLIDIHINVSSVYEGKAVLEHFFSVAASLDSLIVGEREIMGQIKKAYVNAKEAGLCGDNIRLAIQHAILFAKKIYSETRIGEKPVSVVSLAFRQLMQHLVSKDSGVLLIGAGQTNQLLGNFIKKQGFTNVHVFNRTLEKAQELAEKVHGKAYPLSELASFKEPFQVVASCTSAKGHILTMELFEQMNTSKETRYAFLDLAVPRDIDPAIEQKYMVDYVDVEGLEDQAHINMAFRQQEVVKAQALLEEYLEDFEDVYRQRQLELALMEIPEEVKALKSKAYQEVFAKEIDELDDRAKEVLNNIVQYFEKKYIGIPMKIAKKTILGLDNFKD